MSSFGAENDPELTPAEMLMAMPSQDEHILLAVGTLATFADIGNFTMKDWRERVVYRLVRVMHLTNSSSVSTELIQLCAMALSIIARHQMKVREEQGIEIDDHAASSVDPAESLRSFADLYAGEDYLQGYIEAIDKYENEGQIEALNNLLALPSAERPEDA